MRPQFPLRLRRRLRFRALCRQKRFRPRPPLPNQPRPSRRQSTPHPNPILHQPLERPAPAPQRFKASPWFWPAIGGTAFFIAAAGTLVVLKSRHHTAQSELVSQRTTSNDVATASRPVKSPVQTSHPPITQPATIPPANKLAVADKKPVTASVAQTKDRSAPANPKPAAPVSPFQQSASPPPAVALRPRKPIRHVPLRSPYRRRTRSLRGRCRQHRHR